MTTYDPLLLAQLAGLLMVVGAFAGVLAGLLGVGGGIVLVPAFYYVFVTLGFESTQLMQLCVATSLATIIVTSMRSLSSHNKKGAVEWPILRGWGPGIAVGAEIEKTNSWSGLCRPKRPTGFLEKSQVSPSMTVAAP